MKWIIATFIILSAIISNGQDYPKFQLTPIGVAPIVVQLDSMTAQVLYNKTLIWVQKSYKNPDKVFAAKIPDDEIRINGFASNAYYYKTMGMKIMYDTEYILSVQFKDKKLRLQFTPGQAWSNGQRVYNYTEFFKKSGEVKSVYTVAKSSFEDTMNNLTISLCNFLNGKEKKEEW